MTSHTDRDEPATDVLTPPAEPFALFGAWLAEAHGDERIPHAGAACLSTVDPEGRPDARMVIVRRASEAGFVFATDARSAKAAQLAGRADAALTYYWGPLDRQVRVRGLVWPATDAESDASFAGRPRRSRFTPWASHQSRPLDDRATLESSYHAAEARFEGVEEIPRPDTWRAYRLVPSEIELWQAARSRMHHRLHYLREGDGVGAGWTLRLLEP